MKYVEHSDHLQENFLPTDQVHKAWDALKMSNTTTFNMPNIDHRAKYVGSLDVDKCVVPNMHQDLGDFCGLTPVYNAGVTKQTGYLHIFASQLLV